MNTDKELRAALLDFINRPFTHASLIEAAQGLPEKYINEKPAGAAYSFWDML